MEFNILSTLIPLFPFLIFLYMFIKSQTISKSAKIYSHIPGPKALPLIGNLHLMLRASSGPHRLFRDLAAKHGPLMHLQLGELHFLIVSSVDFAKQVMKTHDTNFANRPQMLVAEELAYGSTGVGTSPYGSYWRQLWKICSAELLNAKRVQSFRSIREEESSNLCEWIASRDGSPIDLSERLYLELYDITSRAAVKAKTGEREAMVSIIVESLKLASGFMMADLYPSVKLLPLISGARIKIRRMRRKLDEVLDGIIERHRAAGDADEDAKFEGFLDILLKFEKDGTLTIDNVKAVLLGMFVGGTDTSAATLEWAMSEMIRNPTTLNKAQHEVRKVFDDKGYIDEDKFDELKYLKLIIKETLRLHPALPLLVPRMSSQRCEINGYEIPAGTRVIVNGWGLGRDPEYWNDAEKFMPERFEGSEHDFNGSNLEYIPFGAGRRICPGMLFGLANVELPLAMLLYHFDWNCGEVN
ncbi:desmethyl-deoxy-podophyllotoxin synthase-like [Salvia hispanica]|uniref:desmethyl-deoxy-podophyllotoxin synthase-like n=1 Tax=Salvia hispanica TaxID=49212 RepID=UPI002009A314|nr:desmethyl-deoxy-podophyllotoxin synthase-like [Salvia hispanica]